MFHFLSSSILAALWPAGVSMYVFVSLIPSFTVLKPSTNPHSCSSDNSCLAIENFSGSFDVTTNSPACISVLDRMVITRNSDSPLAASMKMANATGRDSTSSIACSASPTTSAVDSAAGGTCLAPHNANPITTPATNAMTTAA